MSGEFRGELKGFAKIVFLLGVIGAAGLAGGAQERNDQERNNGDTATTIRALEMQWFAAQARHDNRSLDLIFDNDLVYIEYGRTLTKGDYLLRLKTSVAQPGEAVPEAMTVRQFGNAVIVVGTYRERRTAGAKTWAARWRFVDTWVYQARSWVLVSAGAAQVAK